MRLWTFKRQILAVLWLLVALGAAGAGLGLYAEIESLAQFRQVSERVSQRSQAAAQLSVTVFERAVAVRNMLIQHDDASELSREWQRTRSAHERTQALIQDIEASLRSDQLSEQGRALLQALVQTESRYAPVALRVAELAHSGDRAQAAELMRHQCQPLLDELIGAVERYTAYASQSTLAAVEAEQQRAQALSLVIGGLLLASMAAAVGGTAWVRQRIHRALGCEPEDLLHAAHTIAQGDLRMLPGAERAPAGSVLAAMARMREQLLNIVERVRASSDHIATASGQIAQGHQDLSARTETQASSLQETAAATDQLSATVRQNADNARQANQLAANASEVAHKGGQVVDEVVRTMSGIQASAQKIADITGVIDSIAFQTNILALNAAVEAARAGEQGRGFAVVAGEVRALAQRSAQAAREIKVLIESSVGEVREGTVLVDRAGREIEHVVHAIQGLTTMMRDIAAAVQAQRAGIEQVGAAVSGLDQSTQQNAALVEEGAAAATALKQQAADLAAAVARFRVDEGSTAAIPRLEAL